MTNADGKPTISEPSPIRLTTIPTAEQVSDAIDVLRNWDHTGRNEYRLFGGDPVAAKQIIQYGITMISNLSKTEDWSTIDEERRKSMQTVQTELQNMIMGFDFRAENQLPGVSSQIHDIRKQLYEKNIANAATIMDLLQKQPDVGVDVIDQLRHEYQLISDLQEGGVNPDAAQLFNEIVQIIPGVSIQECSTALFKTDRVRWQLGKVTEVVNIQRGQALSFWRKAIKFIPVAREKIIRQVADELELTRSLYIKDVIVKEPILREARTMMESAESLRDFTPEELLNHQIHRLYAILRLSEPMPRTQEGWQTVQRNLISRRVDTVIQISALSEEWQQLHSKEVLGGIGRKEKKRKDDVRKRLDALYDTEKKLSATIEVFTHLIPGVMFSDTLEKMTESRRKE